MTKVCYHCGLDCDKELIVFNDKSFCCNGCKTVYEILNQNELGCYYDLDKSPGKPPKELKEKYAYLDSTAIESKILEFNDGNTAVVELYIPSIHCSACIWVLEHLDKLNQSIINSTVNFPNKTVRISYSSQKITLRAVVELLTSIAYEPYISLDDADKQAKKVDKKIIYQLGYAAFAFSNVMLLALPEYFDDNEFWLNQYRYMFRLLMLGLSIPVVLYSARDYFETAFKGLKKKVLSVDVPIALGIAVLFLRSLFDLFVSNGEVFFDSLTGLVFFLLLGKFFQQKTYNFLSFERDYKSYFPIAVTKLVKGVEEIVTVQSVKKGDRLLIRHDELIPVDGILIKGHGVIDYSFVTGESMPVVKKTGEKVFAGGKQTDSAVEIDVVNQISESYLTELWSNDVFNKKETTQGIESLTNVVSRYFTIVILIIAVCSAGYWLFQDTSMAAKVFTSVLIVACPCALALSAPFALGNMLRIFGYKKFYLKNDKVIEKMSRINHIVFDKTGTITHNDNHNLEYRGDVLNTNDLSLIKTLIRSSKHPLSRALDDYIEASVSVYEVVDFQEVVGNGLQGVINGVKVKLGSAKYLDQQVEKDLETKIYIEIEGNLKGFFISKNIYRNKLTDVFSKLSEKFKISIISGDNAGEKTYLKTLLPSKSVMLFNQKPQDKLNYIKKMQSKGNNVMMVGDGLNDAGALVQSDVGISISEDTNVFSPACDGILDAKNFAKLPFFLKLTSKTLNVVKYSFILSFVYNLIGLYFAITGQLTPIVAAILMPLSSISIVVFVTIATNVISSIEKI